MFGISFGSSRKPRNFNYHPRYWDQEAEEREQRRREVLGDKYQPAKEGEHEPGSLIRDSRMRRMRSAERTKANGGRTILRVAIFIALMLAVFFVLTQGISLF